MSARTLRESEADLVFMLGSVQQKGCSGNKYSRLIDLGMIPVPSIEVFLSCFLQKLGRGKEEERGSKWRRENLPYGLTVVYSVSCCKVFLESMNKTNLGRRSSRTCSGIHLICSVC